MKDVWIFCGCFVAALVVVIALLLTVNSESWTPIDNQGTCVLHTYSDDRLFAEDTEELTIYCKSDILTK